MILSRVILKFPSGGLIPRWLDLHRSPALRLDAICLNQWCRLVWRVVQSSRDEIYSSSSHDGDVCESRVAGLGMDVLLVEIPSTLAFCGHVRLHGCNDCLTVSDGQKSRRYRQNRTQKENPELSVELQHPVVKVFKASYVIQVERWELRKSRFGTHKSPISYFQTVRRSIS